MIRYVAFPIPTRVPLFCVRVSLSLAVSYSHNTGSPLRVTSSQYSSHCTMREHASDLSPATHLAHFTKLLRAAGRSLPWLLGFRVYFNHSQAYIITRLRQRLGPFRPRGATLSDYSNLRALSLTPRLCVYSTGLIPLFAAVRSPTTSAVQRRSPTVLVALSVLCAALHTPDKCLSLRHFSHLLLQTRGGGPKLHAKERNVSQNSTRSVIL